MICWGSWANMQKLTAKTWRFELFYMDFIVGCLIAAVIGAFTIGSLGSEGRPFLMDLAQADSTSIWYAVIGGIVWNLGTFLLVAAMAVAGMAVGFPIGGGLAWVLGILINYFIEGYQGNKAMLFIGVVLIITAIILCMQAYRRLAGSQHKTTTKGIVISILAGITIAFFYGLVVKSLDPAFVGGGTGNLAPSTGVFFFAVGAFISTPIFNYFVTRYPVQGERISLLAYFKGSAYTHFIGIVGGIIWMAGMVISFIAVGSAGPAIGYALSNAAPVVAIFWGVIIWKEFKEAPKGTNGLLAAMFALFIIGLVLITLSK